LIIFNILIAEQPHQDDADLVLSGMVLARGKANIADQFFGWRPCGWDGGFLLPLHSPWGYDEREILGYSNRQFGLMGADTGQHSPTVAVPKNPEPFAKHTLSNSIIENFRPLGRLRQFDLPCV
jgi:hypothetical protein